MFLAFPAFGEMIWIQEHNKADCPFPNCANLYKARQKAAGYRAENDNGYLGMPAAVENYIQMKVLRYNDTL